MSWAESRSESRPAACGLWMLVDSHQPLTFGDVSMPWDSTVDAAATKESKTRSVRCMVELLEAIGCVGEARMRATGAKKSTGRSKILCEVILCMGRGEGRDARSETETNRGPVTGARGTVSRLA